jgi:CRISPR/Cas system type I-B associated protein Csh2 (Cas7 group RAMP superfamily)
MFRYPLRKGGANGDPPLLEKCPKFAKGDRSEMEEARCERRVGSRLEYIQKIFHFSGPSRGNDRDVDGPADFSYEVKIITQACSVPVDGG